MYRIVPSGLHGTYFADVTMTQPIMPRLDPMINMTCSQDLGTAIRCVGFIRSTLEKTMEKDPLTRTPFRVFGAKNVRLWIGGFLVIDEWNRDPGNLKALNGSFYEQLGKIYEVQLEMRLFTETSPSIKLMWSSAEGRFYEFIPLTSFFFKVSLKRKQL